MSRIDAVLERLGRLYPKTIDLSLDRVRQFMGRLGDPHLRLPPTIHVAGTNGKGSTIATLRAVLEAAGFRVHVYTSPHLVRFAERIRLAGQLITDEALFNLLDEAEAANAGRPITLFELTTAAAFLAFSRVPADVLLLETGLGGRLDATNLLQAPAVTAITPISMDHMSFLGDSLELIAAEKAGILKAAVPAVIARQEPSVRAVIAARAAQLGVPLLIQNETWSAQAEDDGWRYRSAAHDFHLPLSRLPGRHQIDNAGLALACLEQLPGVTLTMDLAAAGLATVDWPARLQRLSQGPLLDAVPSDWEIWLDGGHNPAAGLALAESVSGWGDAPLYLIVGMLSNRDPAAFAAPLAPLAAEIRSVAIPGEPNTHSAESCAALLAQAGFKARAAWSLLSAVHSFSPIPRGRILICGSLYLAGQVLVDHL